MGERATLRCSHTPVVVILCATFLWTCVLLSDRKSSVFLQLLLLFSYSPIVVGVVRLLTRFVVVGGMCYSSMLTHSCNCCSLGTSSVSSTGVG